MSEQNDPHQDEDTLIVQGLKPGETYEMQVLAVDRVAISDSEI
jgi:hypothetical protein